MRLVFAEATRVLKEAFGVIVAGDGPGFFDYTQRHAGNQPPARPER
jgi:hypothetical protein